jgi:hypothetical protein
MVEGERARVEVSYLRVRVSAHIMKKKDENTWGALNLSGKRRAGWQKRSRVGTGRLDGVLA